MTNTSGRRHVKRRAHRDELSRQTDMQRHRASQQESKYITESFRVGNSDLEKLSRKKHLKSTVTRHCTANRWRDTTEMGISPSSFKKRYFLLHIICVLHFQHKKIHKKAAFSSLTYSKNIAIILFF